MLKPFKQTPGLEPLPQDGLIPTLNSYGYMPEKPDFFSRSFIEFTSEENTPVMDIGCAYGAVVIECLKNGSSVYAVDLLKDHLVKRSPRYFAKKNTLKPTA